MSFFAKIFAEGYREKPIKTEKRAGTEHLVTGQHEAVWANDEHTQIELSYVNVSGHGFVIVHLDASSLHPLAMHVVSGVGIQEHPVVQWKLSEEGRAAVTKLKLGTALGGTS